MKTIKLLFLIPILAFAGIAHSATISITGTVLSNGVPKSGVNVIFTDSASMFRDTATSNASGIYTITLQTSSASGQADGYIIDCNSQLSYKSVYYRSGTTQYGGVDFVHCTLPPPAGSSKVSGPVYTGTPLAQKAIVLLIEVDSGRLTAVDTSNVVSGRYSFTLPDSNKQYLVKAILLSTDPNYSSYLPTYGDSSLNWSTGNLIPTGGNKNHTRKIWMKKGRNTGGAGFIGGLVTKGANKSQAVGDPIEGAQVMLLENNIPVAYAFSNSNGEFSFDKLENGTYTVYTEVIGLPTVSADVVISNSNNKEEGVRVSINSSGVTTSVWATSIESFNAFSELKAFPNPVKNELTVQFSSELESGVISIVDLTGKTIHTEEINNLNELGISFENYKTGTYLVKIISSENSSVLRVVKQ